MSSDASYNSLKQSDLLYLIFQYFQTVPGFGASAEALRGDLTNSSVLGTSIGWDGSVRKCDVHDLSRIYPNIASDHILQLLQSALSHLSSTQSNKLSLLHQIKGNFNPNNVVQFKRFVELSMKNAEIFGKFRSANKLLTKTKLRISYLENIIHVDSSYKENSHEEIEMNEDVVPVLQEVGRAKELSHLHSQIISNQNSVNLLNVEVDTITKEMAQLGCLSSGTHRGHIDGGLAWLQSRELGLTSFGYGSGLAFGRNLVPSAINIQNKILTQYHLLWTVSGHMMNPAYCCVYDQTGRYILSGADDYLVKIWDVATGQLIKTCKGHMGYISLIAVSPDNSLFASACTMGTIRIWRLIDGLCLQVLKHKASVNWIKFDRTSCALASASDDGHCIVWDLSKLLPEDGGEVPILDVIMEDRAAALKEAGLVGGSNGMRLSRELDQLNRDDFYEPAGGIHRNVLQSISAECGGDTVGIASSSNAIYAPSSSSAVPVSVSNDYSQHHGEARLLSAINSSASTGLTGAPPPGISAQGPVPDSVPMHAPIQLFNSRGGLFRWSGGIGGQHQEETDAMLTLHHLDDVLQRDQGADPMKVQCLDISPMGNILVTGCEDGVARVWRIGDPEQVGGYSKRQSRLPMEDVLQKLKHLCSPNEYGRLQRVASHLLLRLEGHVSPITDIHLNHLGDRVLTGSAQDCSVRIWSLSKDHTKSVQIVLDLSEEEDGGSSEDLFASRVRGGRGARMRQKSQLYNACWTSDSSKIVTIQSVLVPGRTTDTSLPTRLKVWDGMTGDLLKVIWKIGDVSCRSLCTHPLHPSIVVTCGEDGYINFWDIDQEQRMSTTRLYNDEEKATPSNIVDASFSPDGTTLAVTDFLGRLSVLGLDDPERFRSVRSEQYFSTDYLDIMLDSVGFAVDVGTQLPVHEAPIGPLIMMDGTPYDTQPPSRQGPQALSKDEIRQMLREITQDRKKCIREMDRVFNVFSRNQHRGRLPKKYRGMKPKSIRAAEELVRLQQQGNNSSTTPRESRVQYIEFDVNTYNPSSDESEDSDYGVQRDHVDISRIHEFPESNRRRGTGVGSRRRERRSNIVTFNSSQRRSNRARTNISSYDEDVLEGNAGRRNQQQQRNGDVAAGTASRANRAQQREARRHMAASEESDSADSDEDTENSGSDNILYFSDEHEHQTRSRRSSQETRASRSSSKRSSRRSMHNNNHAEEDEDEENEDDLIVAAPARRPQVKRQAFFQAKHGTVLLDGTDVNRNWLQSEALTPQYSPQLGDKVMYFPQGHIQWLQQFQESSSPPWMSFPQKWPIVECEVRDIQYMFPDTAQEYKMCCSVKAKVKLAVVRIPVRNSIISGNQYVLEMAVPRSTRHKAGQEITFTVTLRDWDMPDFLIPSDVFMRSIRLAWHTGIRVHVQFKDYSADERRYIFKTYSGQVEGVSNASSEWPQSPWDCIQVNWDDTEEGSADAATKIGPWEAIPQYDRDSHYSQILSNFPLTRLPEAECLRIKTEIEMLMSSEEYSTLFTPFYDDVNAEVFPSYYSAIPVPICVHRILERLRNGYYRQLEAVEFDVKLMLKNCENYNYEESEIVIAARQLKKHLLKILRQGDETVESSTLQDSATADADTMNEMEEDAPTGLMIKLRTGSRSSRAAAGHAHREDSLVNLGGGASPVKHSRSDQRRRSGAQEAGSETSVLRIKRGYEETVPHSSSKSQRISAETTGSRSRRSGAAAVAEEEPLGRSSRYRNSTFAENVEQSRTSSHSRRSSARGRAVDYSERNEEEFDDSDGDKSDQDASSEQNDEEMPVRCSSSRHASAVQSHKRTLRGKSTQHHVEHDEDSDASKNDQNSSQEEEEEVVTTTRSKRAVKPPPNFAEEMAQTIQYEHERNVAQRRRSESAHHLAAAADVTATNSSSSRGGRLNPSQRYQEEQRRLQSEREEQLRHQEHQRAQRSRYNNNTSTIESTSTSIDHSRSSNRRLDPEVKKAMMQMVDCADSLDEEHGIFAQPVTEDIAPGYFDIISHPVDLSTVREKIHKRQYETIQEVAYDIRVMYDNCELYNDDTSLLGKETQRQRNEFKKYCRKHHITI